MTADGLAVLQCLFQVIWRLFTSWYIPGTRTTPAAFFLFLIAAGLALRFIVRLFGIAGSAALDSKSVSKENSGMPYFGHDPALPPRSDHFDVK